MGQGGQGNCCSGLRCAQGYEKARTTACVQVPGATSVTSIELLELSEGRGWGLQVALTTASATPGECRQQACAPPALHLLPAPHAR